MAGGNRNGRVFSLFEDVVLVVIAVAGLGGGLAVLWAKAPPVIVSIFLGTGVATVVYRFLGGILPGTSVTIGAFKLGGSLAALLATAFLIDDRLANEIEIKGESIIRGTLENLQAEETMTSRATNLYTRRVYGDWDKGFDYDWRIITPAPLPDGTKVSFYFDRGLQTGRSATQHELTVRAAFYTDPVPRVQIQYARGTDKLWLVFGGKREELPPLDPMAHLEIVRPADGRARPWPTLLTTVFAQSVPRVTQPITPELIVRRLESPDPIVRREARTRLARLGKSALPNIRSAIQDPNSSYRIRLGVLAALNESQGILGDDLSGAPFKAILDLAGSADPTMSDEAFRFLTKVTIAGSADVTGAPATHKVRVKGTTPVSGDFLFHISVSNPDITKLRVSLQEIDCFEDSSPGPTRWLFKLFANGITMSVPDRGYADDGKPHKYATSPAERSKLTVDLPAAKALQLRIVGYKPKHIS